MPRSAAAEVDDDIEAKFRQLGDKINDKIEGTETQLDDFAKERLVKGLKAFVAELEVEGVDNEQPPASDAPPAG